MTSPPQIVEIAPHRVFPEPISELGGLRIVSGRFGRSSRALSRTLEVEAGGLVPRLPSGVLASSLMLLATVGFIVGAVLDDVLRASQATAGSEYLRWAFSDWEESR